MPPASHRSVRVSFKDCFLLGCCSLAVWCLEYKMRYHRSPEYVGVISWCWNNIIYRYISLFVLLPCLIYLFFQSLLHDTCTPGQKTERKGQKQRHLSASVFLLALSLLVCIFRLWSVISIWQSPELFYIQHINMINTAEEETFMRNNENGFTKWTGWLTKCLGQWLTSWENERLTNWWNC